MQVIAQWSGGQADALRRALRMTVDEFAERVQASPRTVAYWRERPSIIPQASIQRKLDAALDSASDRAKAQFALFDNGSMEQLAETIDAHGSNPDEQARVRSVLCSPSHLDGATIEYLTQGLYGQRHAEDSLGATVMLAPLSTQLETLKTLLRETSGPHEPALTALVADWTTFVAWLHTEMHDYAKADATFAEAEEMSDDIGDGVLASTATSYRGYLALLQGRYRAAIRNTMAALATPGAHPTHLAYCTMQAAQAYAGLGDLREANRLLGQASDLVTGVGEPPKSLYWYTEPFLRMNIGLTQHAIGENRDAADSLTSGIAGISADQRDAEWMEEYRQALARAEAADDPPES